MVIIFIMKITVNWIAENSDIDLKLKYRAQRFKLGFDPGNRNRMILLRIKCSTYRQCAKEVDMSFFSSIYSQAKRNAVYEIKAKIERICFFGGFNFASIRNVFNKKKFMYLDAPQFLSPREHSKLKRPPLLVYMRAYRVFSIESMFLKNIAFTTRPNVQARNR